jgi:hypothetical protein
MGDIWGGNVDSVNKLPLFLCIVVFIVTFVITRIIIRMLRYSTTVSGKPDPWASE